MPKIFEERDGETIAAEIVMLRADSPDCTILIVEGDSDYRFMTGFIEYSMCEMLVAEGHENAIKAVAVADKLSVAGIICLLDRDAKPIVEREGSGTAFVFTDESDLETMLMRSPAFQRVLAEMGSAEKLKRARARKQDAQQLICDAAAPVGALRHISRRDALHLKFETISYDFVDRRTLIPNVTRLINEVLAKSRNFTTAKATLRVRISELIEQVGNLWDICCGHDLTAIFGRSLCSLFGTLNSGEALPRQIESRLRLAFGAREFCASLLFKSIRRWEKANVPFVCLRPNLAGG
jgi:hypothetical protein